MRARSLSYNVNELKDALEQCLLNLASKSKGSIVTFTSKKLRRILRVRCSPIMLSVLHDIILNEYKDAIVSVRVEGSSHRKKVLFHRKALLHLLNNGREIPESVLREVRELRREFMMKVTKPAIKAAIEDIEGLGFEVNVGVLIQRLKELGYDTSNFYDVLREMISSGEIKVNSSRINSKDKTVQTAIDDFLVR